MEGDEPEGTQMYLITLLISDNTYIECVSELDIKQYQLLSKNIGAGVYTTCCGTNRCILCKLSPEIVNIEETTSELEINEHIVSKMIEYFRENN